MIKKALIVALILISYISGFSQIDSITHDPMAKQILDNLSNKLKDKNARYYFVYNMSNAQDSSNIEYYGYLFSKGQNMYKVMIPDIEIFSDGIKTYSYNKKNNEMNITLVDPNDDAVYTPQRMVNAYKSGYKYSYRGVATFDAKVKINGQITTKNKSCHVVDLYPENIKNTNLSIIRLWIDENTNELVSAKFQYDSGIDETVEILSCEIGVTINDDIFKFDKSKYPADLDVIDFTED